TRAPSLGSSVRPRRRAARVSCALLFPPLFVALAQWPAMAAPPSEAPSAAPTPKPAAPAKDAPVAASIPVPEVARQAEEVAKTLRDIDALQAPGTAIENIERRLPDNGARCPARAAGTNQQGGVRPSCAELGSVPARC